MTKRVADLLIEKLQAAGVEVLRDRGRHAEPDRPCHRPQPDPVGPCAS
jgi:hypothetical protein